MDFGQELEGRKRGGGLGEGEGYEGEGFVCVVLFV